MGNRVRVVYPWVVVWRGKSWEWALLERRRTAQSREYKGNKHGWVV